jgi:hypothetical protein
MTKMTKTTAAKAASPSTVVEGGENSSRIKTFPKVDPSQWPNGGPVYFCNAAATAATTTTTIPSKIPNDSTTTCSSPSPSSIEHNNNNSNNNNMEGPRQEDNRYPPLPLGEPIEFETDYFRGKFLLRIRDLPPPYTSDKVGCNTNTTKTSNNQRDIHHEAYFHGRKRFFQMVVQGQFKTAAIPAPTTTTSTTTSTTDTSSSTTDTSSSTTDTSSSTTSSSPSSAQSYLTFADLLLGATYDRPFIGIPGRKSQLLRMIQGFIEKVNPGMVFDIGADKPKILTALGACQVLRVDRQGYEPDMCHPHGIVEDTTLMTSTIGSVGGCNTGNDKNKNHQNKKTTTTTTKKDPPSVVFTSAKDRRKKLAQPRYSSQFVVDPDLVYTFENYDDTIDLASYHQHFGKGIASIHVDLADKMNGQPMSTTAMIKDTDKILFDFHIWHERLWRNVIASETTKKSTHKEKS